MKRIKATLSAASAIALAAFLGAPASAQSSTVTAETRGGAVVIDRTARSEGVAGGASTLTAGDRSAERVFERTYDPATGTYNAARFTTAANGAQVSSSATVTCDGNGVCTRSGDYAGPRGNTGGSETTAIVSGDGKVTARTTASRPDGTGVTRDRAISGAPGERSGDIVQTGPRGETSRQFDRQAERGEGLATSSATTGPRGHTRLVDRQRQRADSGGIDAAASVTSPRGETRDRRRWVRIDRHDKRD